MKLTQVLKEQKFLNIIIFSSLKLHVYIGVKKKTYKRARPLDYSDKTPLQF